MINSPEAYQGSSYISYINPIMCHQLSYCFKQIEALKIFAKEEFKIRNVLFVTSSLVAENKSRNVCYKVFVLDSIKESLRALSGG